jgi:hypothetical protein
MNDYEIDEIRRIRHQIAAEQGYDVKNLANYYCQVEQLLRISGKYRFIDKKRDSVEQKHMKKTATS